MKNSVPAATELGTVAHTMFEILAQEQKFFLNQVVFDLRYGFGLITDIYKEKSHYVQVTYDKHQTTYSVTGQDNPKTTYRSLLTKEEAELLGFICAESYPALVFDYNKNAFYVTQDHYDTLEDAEECLCEERVHGLVTDIPQLVKRKTVGKTVPFK